MDMSELSWRPIRANRIWSARVSLAPTSGNLDFDARVPIPISIFPSTYRSNVNEQESTTRTRVEGEVDTGRVGREDRYTSLQVNARENDRPRRNEDVRIYEEHDRRRDDRTRIDRVDIREDRHRDRIDEVEIREDRREPRRRTEVDIELEREAPRYETEIDVTEREARRRFSPTLDVEVGTEYERRRPIDGTTRETRIEVEKTDERSRGMGYYDDEGHYHSFRRGVERATDRLLHPFRHDREEVVIERDEVRHRDRDVIVERGEAGPRRDEVRFVERRRGGHSSHTITIPCHHIRIGDLLILQGRPCQVIRITTSAQTGQHRYLGVDLFTKQLHEESSFSTNPSPSVYVQNMLGPVFKQYRVLDIRDDGYVTAMTENGDVKQSLAVIEHGSLWDRLNGAFADGRGSLRVLVINDGGRELAVDYKVIHGSRL